MGNCLQSPTSDDISLLRGSDGNPDTNDASDLDSPPPYNQEQVGRGCKFDHEMRNTRFFSTKQS